MTTEQMEDRILSQLEGMLAPDEERAFFADLEKDPAMADLYEEYRRQGVALSAHYRRQGEVLDSAPLPELPRATVVPIPARPMRGLRMRLAAAAALVAAAGLGGYGVWNARAPQAGAPVVLAASGTAQSIAAGSIASVLPDAAVPRTTERLKTGSGGYMEVALPGSAGRFEMNHNSTVRLAGHAPGRGIELERGEILVSMDAPGKAPSVRTPDIEIKRADGTFSVVRGLRGSEVTVLSGTVDVYQGAARRTLTTGESFSSVGAATRPVADRIDWSRHRETLVASSGGVAPVGAAATTITPGATAGSLAIGGTPVPIVTSYLPTGTLLLFETPSLDALARPLGADGLADLFSVERSATAVRRIGEVTQTPPDEIAVGEQEIRDVLSMPQVRAVLSGLGGSAAVGIGKNGPILLADVRGHEDAVADAIQDGLLQLQSEGAEVAPLFVDVVGGILVLGVASPELDETLAALREARATAFGAGAFVQELRTTVPGSQFTAAFDAASFASLLRGDGSAKTSRILARMGLDNMRSAIAGTTFADQAGNQALRVTFDGPRTGMAGWLDAPGAMGSLRFFSPDVHGLVAMKVRQPQLVLNEVLGWAGEDGITVPTTPDQLAIASRLAASLGNEVAIGLDNPVLPVPNVKVAFEVVDPGAFHQAMIDLVTEMWKAQAPASQVEVTTADHRGHMIVNLRYPGMTVGLSYALIEDFVVFGPGQPFLEGTIDTFRDGRSIDREYAFLNSLPAASGTHASMLLYTALNKTLQEVVPLLESQVPGIRGAAALGADKSTIPEGGGAVAYAIAGPDAVDLYIQGVTLADYRMSGMVPVVADWLAAK